MAILSLSHGGSKIFGGGLELKTIRRLINENHPLAPINEGNLSQALSSLASLQVKKKISPIVLDYDQSRRRLNVVDKGFLIWLNYQNREELRRDLDLPTTPAIPTGVSWTSA